MKLFYSRIADKKMIGNIGKKCEKLYLHSFVTELMFPSVCSQILMIGTNHFHSKKLCSK